MRAWLARQSSPGGGTRARFAAQSVAGAPRATGAEGVERVEEVAAEHLPDLPGHERAHLHEGAHVGRRLDL
jgi:hypothetical protein